MVDEPLSTFSCDGLRLLDETCSPCALVSSGALSRYHSSHMQSVDCVICVYRLLSTADVCSDGRFHGNSVQLCGHKFITCRAFAADTRAAFMLIRQSLNDLDQCVESGGSVGVCVCTCVCMCICLSVCLSVCREGVSGVHCRSVESAESAVCLLPCIPGVLCVQVMSGLVCACTCFNVWSCLQVPGR